ncbi:MAG TPA: hypothetical protein VJT50_00065 [Pyrinomonadaceae bacterium]|nr:hypothetical protein [Pyrinomonadaceae bacterium]
MFTANKQRQIVTTSMCGLFFVIASIVYAGQPVIWETGSRTELLKGDARGVSISDTGVLTLAPNVTEVFNTSQAFVWSTASDSQGNIFLGTGHDGKIFRVTPDGRGTLLYDAAELDITALAVAKDGSLYAGSSPDGKVYRISANGTAEVFFDPGDKYIWSLALMNDGSLAVGTGDNGKLYRVRNAGAKAEGSLLLSTNQTHVMSLAVTAQGDLIAGTDPGGLVLRISPDGKAFALYDAPLREIHALTVAQDGSIYALGLSDSAATSRPQSTTVAVPQSGDSSGGTAATSVTITAIDESGNPIQTATPAVRSRTDISNARSAVFRVLPDGATDVVWSSTSITAFAIAPALETGSVLIGTADKGRTYSVTNDGRDTLLLQSTEGQISSFVTRAGQVYAASSNQGKLFRFGKETVTEGSYESSVHDAKLTATWGRIWWRGGGNVELQTRSGNGERPDATWSDWSPAYRTAEGTQITSPRARFLQWRATLRPSAGGQTWVEDPTVAYLPRNVAPEVLSVTSLPFGVGLQPGAAIQVDPNIESSGLDPSLFGAVAVVPPRRIFQRGARSFQWQAEDRNGDTLEYAIYYRALNDQTFRLLRDKLGDNFFTIDGATLADGRYVIKIVASDAPDNPAGEALTGERVSEPVDIDNTPPVVRAAAQSTSASATTFDADDATGKIRRADFSIDGGAWIPVFPEDGIADSGHERYSVPYPAARGDHTVSLRVFDGSGNVGTLSVNIHR